MICVIKKSGEIEPLSEEKIKSCVARVGGSYCLAEKITKEIIKKLPNKITSENLYKRVFERLKKENIIYPLRLNLKKAIFDLGPTGFPFEKYFSKLLEFFGYKTEINLHMAGKCIKHEIDILAEKNQEKYLIECKFHQNWGTKSDVHTPMYVLSRVLDINEKNNSNFIPWIATNTRLSFDAVNFSECRNIKATSWGYPLGDSLERMIEQSKKYPITILISGNIQIFQKLISQSIILVEDILKFDRNYIQKTAGVSSKMTEGLFKEAEILAQG